MELRIRDLEGCAVLARGLAACLRAHPPLRCVLLRGPLGSGKTTLVRFLVEALPGGEMAEVSSPSFTLCNVYPTTPEILHCDLYRAGANPPEELDVALEAGEALCLVEWAEYLPPALLPEDFLDIHMGVCEEYRLVRIAVHSRNSAPIQNCIERIPSELL